ncbi:ribosome-inactivating family protein [Paraburkholderia terrae]|uniref:hypothetical protein n=1 Tax=Paraburkholderia terrae TaxID=311230 RepID=UPI00296AF9CF|nr:hypothetical protein [Paraburkholderia terrae]MDW3655639.1 hypothetical protein [Paraburkholderia terrae]
MSRYDLYVDARWDTQIAAIRNEISEETNIWGFGNVPYRICKDQGGTFLVRLWSGDAPSRGYVDLAMLYRDLYLTSINGTAFVQYASTIKTKEVNGGTLRDAVYRLSRGDGSFEQKSFVVFCVAESLRFDFIAREVRNAIALAKGGMTVAGRFGQLSMGDLAQAANNWGQASEQIFAAMSDTAKQLVLRPRSALTTAERRFSEIVDESRIDRKLDVTRRVTLLKRPNLKASTPI